MFEIKIDSKTKQTLNWIESLPKRMDAYKKAVLFNISAQYLNNVKSSIPSDLSTAEYKDSIQLASLQSSSKEMAYIIYINPKSRRLKKLETNKSIIYIKHKNVKGSRDSKVLVLEKYSPWTLDTLPFMPDKKNAEIIHRVSNETTVLNTSKKRKNDALFWKRDLSRLGITFSNRNIDIPFKSKAKTDIEYQALRMEFGLDGNNSKSHWRLALSKLAPSDLTSIITETKLDRILSDPSFTNYSTVVPNTLSRITPNEARTFSSFAKRLGIIK